NLLAIHNELVNETYAPSRYREFIIKEPKERLILALPFRDRVVHQAICNIIEPLFEGTLIYDTYACRKNKGTLAGINRLSYFLNKRIVNDQNVYCLKMDISKYFYSIDHAALKKIIERKIRCRRTLRLLDAVIDSTDDPGIPVGNLTSQLFANIYLNKLDHFIKEELRVKHYVRYMDDMIILHDDKRYLWKVFIEIKNFTEQRLKLKFNKKTSVFKIERGIDFLGYRQFKKIRILRKRVYKKNIKKFKKFVRSGKNLAAIRKSLASLHGVCKHCSSTKVINRIKNIIGDKKWEQIYTN